MKIDLWNWTALASDPATSSNVLRWLFRQCGSRDGAADLIIDRILKHPNCPDDIATECTDVWVRARVNASPLLTSEQKIHAARTDTDEALTRLCETTDDPTTIEVLVERAAASSSRTLALGLVTNSNITTSHVTRIATVLMNAAVEASADTIYDAVQWIYAFPHTHNLVVQNHPMFTTGIQGQPGHPVDAITELCESWLLDDTSVEILIECAHKSGPDGARSIVEGFANNPSVVVRYPEQVAALVDKFSPHNEVAHIIRHHSQHRHLFDTLRDGDGNDAAAAYLKLDRLIYIPQSVTHHLVNHPTISAATLLTVLLTKETVGPVTGERIVQRWAPANEEPGRNGLLGYAAACLAQPPYPDIDFAAMFNDFASAGASPADLEPVYQWLLHVREIPTDAFVDHVPWALVVAARTADAAHLLADIDPDDLDVLAQFAEGSHLSLTELINVTAAATGADLSVP